jgi:hypothetical protein
MFVVSFGGKQYLFDCRFDESADEYPDVYQVYVLRNLGEHELNGSWDGLPKRAHQHLGEVLVKSVVFDESRRLTGHRSHATNNSVVLSNKPQAQHHRWKPSASRTKRHDIGEAQFEQSLTRRSSSSMT